MDNQNVMHGEKIAHQNGQQGILWDLNLRRSVPLNNLVWEHSQDEAQGDKDDWVRDELRPGLHPLVVAQEHPLVDKDDDEVVYKLPTIKVMTMMRKRTKVMVLW